MSEQREPDHEDERGAWRLPDPLTRLERRLYYTRPTHRPGICHETSKPLEKREPSSPRSSFRNLSARALSLFLSLYVERRLASPAEKLAVKCFMYPARYTHRRYSHVASTRDLCFHDFSAIGRPRLE